MEANGFDAGGAKKGLSRLKEIASASYSRKDAILFYYHNFGGLGHGTRILSICRAVRELGLDIELVVLNSGRPQPQLNIRKYAKVIDMPPIDAVSGLFDGICSQEGLESAFSKRAALLERTLKVFNIKIALFEHFPFGRRYLSDEIEQFIARLKQSGAKIYSSVRDIIDQDVDISSLEEDIRLFNGVLVHSDSDVGFVSSFERSNALMEKIVFTGRLMPYRDEDFIPEDVIRSQLKCNGRRLIVVAVGGGIDGINIIDRILGIKKILDRHFGSIMLISTGPSVDASAYASLSDRVFDDPEILLTKFNAHYVDYVNAADLSISMGGYNSVNNALYIKTPAIIFPRQTDSEQKTRCRIYEDYFDSFDIRNLSDEELSRIVIDKLLSVKESEDSLVKISEKISLEIVDDTSDDTSAKVSVETKVSIVELDRNGPMNTARFLYWALNLEMIKIRLTTECNMRCDMCSWKKQDDGMMEKDAVDAVIRDASILGVKAINFTGGEATMHPDLSHFLKHSRSFGSHTSLSTNGLLSKHIVSGLSPMLDFVDVSIDSHESSMNDRIRGIGGAYDNAIKTIVGLEGSVRLLHVNVTVRPDNYKGIHKMIPLLSKYIDSISFSLVDSELSQLEHLIFRKEELEEYYFDEVLEILRVSIVHDIRCDIRPFFNDLEDNTPREMISALLKDKDRYIASFSDIFMPSGDRCYFAQHQLRLDTKGSIKPCCSLDDIGIDIGNIFSMRLIDIVISERYFDFCTSAQYGKGICKCCMRGMKKYFIMTNPNAGR